MRQCFKFFLAVLVLTLLVTNLRFNLSEISAEGAKVNTIYGNYTSEEGVKWTSYSTKWDTKRLQQLNQVLLNNAHGEEIYKLREVIIYSDDFMSGTYEKGVIGTYHNNTIELAFGDYRTEEEILYTLTHEYGHHFTMYYLPSLELWNEWAKVRNLDLYPVILGPEILGQSYEWEKPELVVNDYIMFYASPEIRLIGFDSDSQHGFENVLYREPFNKDVTYGDTVPGLRDFWENITGIKTTSKQLTIPKLHSIKTEKEHAKNFIGDDITYYSHTFYFSGMNTDTSYALNKNGFYCYSHEPCFFKLSEDELDENGLYAITLKISNLVNNISLYAFDPESGNYAESLKYFFIEEDSGILKAAPYNMIQPVGLSELYDPKEYKRIWIFVNNVLQAYNSQPQIINGSTFVPFRELMESMGAVVRWDGVNQTVTATLGDQTISFVPNSIKIVINEVTKTLSPAPIFVNNSTFVPMRFIAEALGAEVKWEAEINSIYITK